MHFPMFVVRVEDFLEMAAAIPHQELRKAGLAIEHRPGSSGLAIFVSHQWCSRRHPDPHFHQLSVLQTVFRTAAAGKLHLDTDFFSQMVFRLRPAVKKRELRRLAHAWLWYDYFSVPQPDAPMAGSDQHTDQCADLGKAVMSIPAYVDRCEYFLILAPSVPYADDPECTMDFTTWKSRGWCRLERVARVLSPRTTHMLLVADGRTLLHVGAQHYLLDAVGDGAFTVDADREILGPVLVDLLRRKLQALLAAGDLHRYRRLLAAREAVLHALPGVVPSDCCAPGFRPQGRADVVEDFLDLYGFRSATNGGGGVQPILFAATLGDPGLLEGLLARRASVMARELRDDAEFVAPRGDTVLHRACLGAYGASAVHVLLQHRADPVRLNDTGTTPLMMAAIGGHTEAVVALLSAGADMCARNQYRVDPLICAAAFGRLAVVRQLLALGHPASHADGMSPLLAASLFGSGPATVSAILEAPSDSLEARFQAGSRSTELLFAWRSLPFRLWGSRRRLGLLLYHLAGATPLMVAAIMGNIAEARALVAAGADATARNSRGMTAFDLAELVGTSPLNLAFFREPEMGEYLN